MPELRDTKLKLIVIVFAVLLTRACAQSGTTVVSGQVKDINNSLYVNCQWSVTFVGQNTTPNVGPYLPDRYVQPQQGTCDSNANFTVNLGDNINTILPTPSQWQLNICSTTGYVPGNQFCFQFLQTVTGPALNLTSVMQQIAPVLPQSPQSIVKLNNVWTGSNAFLAGATFGPPALPYIDVPEDSSGLCAYNPSSFSAGQIQVCNPGNGSNALWSNAGNGNTQLFSTRLPSSSAFINGAVPQWVAANNDYEILPISAPSVLPAAQAGDCVRFNSLGDSAWDAINCAAIEMDAVYAVSGGTPVGFGTTCVGNVGFATGTGNTNVFPTATRRPGVTYFITPGASASTVEGMTCGQNGSNSLFPIVAWYRYSTLFALGTTTTARFWMGLATWNNGSGTGTNSTAILNTTKFATDTPNSNTIAFRFSSTTDTTFKAVACVAGGACTVTDTGVTADTSPHLFEMAMNSAGNSVNYFIDSALKATISTNLPTAIASADGQADIFWTADNKNNVSSPNATVYSMQFSLK
jgi:hypothetical protein